MSEYAEVMKSQGELRKTVESRLDDCITREKAEKIAEAAVSKAHPAQRKAVLPETPEQVLERADGFRLGGKNTPEKPWTSEYGRKFGGMRGFLKAARGATGPEPKNGCWRRRGSPTPAGRRPFRRWTCWSACR